jgi:hypothetical protein
LFVIADFPDCELTKVYLLYCSNTVFGVDSVKGTSRVGSLYLYAVDNSLIKRSSGSLPGDQPESVYSGLIELAYCLSLFAGGSGMMALIEQLVAGAGVSQEQAEGGAGLLFGLVKDQLSSGDFSQVAQAVPGIDSVSYGISLVQ